MTFSDGTSLAVPMVHLNGTGQATLLVNLEKAHSAICLALEALQQTAPNARDYYPQKAGTFQRAVDEHSSRMNHLIVVRSELERIAEAVSNREV